MRLETMHQALVPVSSVAHLSAALALGGIDAQDISQAMGHVDRRAGAEESFIRATDEWQAQRNFVELLPNDVNEWFRTGLRYRLVDNGTIALALMTAASIRECLVITERLADLIFTAARIRPLIEGQWVVGQVLDVSDVPIGMREFCLYHILGGTLTGMSDLWLGPFPWSHIEIEFQRPDAIAKLDIENYCPVIFNAPRNAIHWNADLSERPIFHASPTMNSIYLRECSALMRTTKEAGGLLGQIVCTIGESLQKGQVSLKTVSTSLGMSERTLQRRLEEHGYSFRGVLDMVRARRARTLLSIDGRRVEEVALDVGYADGSSFSQAFFRWTGHRPSRVK